MYNREETIKKQMAYCQHYDPPLKGVTACKCGVVYDDQFPTKPIPCWKGGNKTDEEQQALCPRWLRQTREQGEARADEVEAAINRLTVVGPVVAEWRSKTPENKSEVIECPMCKGRLHLSQSAYNGHVHGKCETEKCVSFME